MGDNIINIPFNNEGLIAILVKELGPVDLLYLIARECCFEADRQMAGSRANVKAKTWWNGAAGTIEVARITIKDSRI